MKMVHVLYGESTNIGLLDLLEQTKIQAKLLNLPIVVSYLKKGQSDYNIQSNSMIVINY